MKYYIYVSDAKIDMLLPQIAPEIKKRIATELKIDLKILSATRKTEKELSDDRIARLEAVCEFLLEYADVGTIGTPGEYFGGVEDMRWGPLKHPAPDCESPFVFFASQTDTTICCLGGAARHVIGETGSSPTSARSHTPYLLAHIVQALGLRATRGDILGPEHPGADSPIDSRFLANLARHDSAKAIWWAFAQSMTNPEQRLEFLAKRLIYDINPRPERRRFDIWEAIPESAWNAERILFGTPLYVALAE